MVKKITEITDEILNSEVLTPKDIPDIDLYMDQILTLFDNKMASSKRFDDDKLLTKTMINNYSKAKVIEPVKGKKYTKQQILEMLLVFDLKNNLSINEIKNLLEPIYNSETEIIDIYQNYLNRKNEINVNITNLIVNLFDNDIKGDKEMLLSIMELAYLSNSINKIILKLIDNREEDKVNGIK